MFRRIVAFLSPPVFSDEEQTRAARLLNLLVLSVAVAALIAAVAAQGRPVFVWLGVVVPVLAWAVMRRGYVRAASVGFVAGLAIVAALIAFNSGGVRAPHYTAFFGAILLAGLLLGWREAVAMAVLGILVGAAMLQAESRGLLPEARQYDRTFYWVLNSMYFAVTAVILSLALQLINDALARANRELAERTHAEQVLTESAQALRAANAELRAAKSDIERSLAESEARTHEMSGLSNLSELLQMSHSLTEAGDVITKVLPSLFPGYAGALYIVNPSRDLAETISVWGKSPAVSPTFRVNDCWALRRGGVHINDAGHGNPSCRHDSSNPLDSSLCVPLAAQGETMGILHLHSEPVEKSPAAAFTDAQLTLARTLSDGIALALANVLLREKLHGLSMRDPLTGLFNRRYMEETLEREVRRAARLQAPLGVIVADLDLFKRFNDTFGHGGGDALLRELGAFLSRHVRGEDVACRLGGEEFVLILPGLDVDAILLRAEQLRDGVRGLRVQYDGQILTALTASFGVAVYPNHGDSGEALLAAADAALYRAKQGGRDGCVVAGMGAEPHG